MCGAELTPAARRPLLAIPWADVALLAVVVAVIAIWWSRPAASEPTAATAPTATPTDSPFTLALSQPDPPPEETMAAPPAESTPAEPTATIPTPVPTIHRVKAGETLLSIAAQYGVTLEALKAANGLTDRSILQIDQAVIIPSAGGSNSPTLALSVAAQPTAASNVQTYEVQQGDSIYVIAVRFGTTEDAIKKLNNLTAANPLIRPGDKLLVPVGLATAPTATPQPTATPAPALLAVANPTPEPRRVPAPTLLGPAAGARFDGDVPILLRWASIGVLAADETYLVRVWPADAVSAEPVSTRTTATSWRVPIEAKPHASATSYTLYWTVEVVQSLGLQTDTMVISEGGEIRQIEWH